jgi:hypothetical protein
LRGGSEDSNHGVKLSVREGEEKYGRHGDMKPENISVWPFQLRLDKPRMKRNFEDPEFGLEVPMVGIPDRNVDPRMLQQLLLQRSHRKVQT